MAQTRPASQKARTHFRPYPPAPPVLPSLDTCRSNSKGAPLHRGAATPGRGTRRWIGAEVTPGRFFEGPDVLRRIAPFVVAGVLPFLLLPLAGVSVRRRGGARGVCPAWADRRHGPLASLGAAARRGPRPCRCSPTSWWLHCCATRAARTRLALVLVAICRSPGSHSTARGCSCSRRSVADGRDVGAAAAIIGEPLYGGGPVSCARDRRGDRRGADRARCPGAGSDDAAAPASAGSRAVLDASQDAFISIDADGLVIEWNPQAERIFGWSRR